MILSFQPFASVMSASSCLVRSGRSSLRDGSFVDRAMDDDLAVARERQSLKVPAPRDGGRDAHVGRRPELALPFDQLGGAVDAQAARRPRLGRNEVVDDERDLGAPSLHVAILPRAGWVQATYVQERAVELKADRHDVWLPIGRHRRDTGEPLAFQVCRFFVREGHVAQPKSGWRANHRGRFSTSGTRERVRSKSARKDGGVANQRNILLTSSLGPRTSSGTWMYVTAAPKRCASSWAIRSPVTSSPAISTGAVSGSRRVRRAAAALPMSFTEIICSGTSPGIGIRTSSSAPSRAIIPSRFSMKNVGRMKFTGTEPMRNSSMRLLLSKCGMPVFRSAPPTEL